MSEQSRAKDKWGLAAEAGFQMLPDLLLLKQTALELSPTDMIVLINISMSWWYADQRPFPRTSTIARRMGVTIRTVQRSLKKLQKKGLIIPTYEKVKDGSFRTTYDLSGLKLQLEDFAEVSLHNLIQKTIRQGGLQFESAL